MSREFSPEEQELMSRMRRQGYGWRAICAAVGCGKSEYAAFARWSKIPSMVSDGVISGAAGILPTGSPDVEFLPDYPVGDA